jgi:phage baseplate assembly protein W
MFQFPDIIGAGWGFPVRIDHRRGGIELARLDVEIEEAIQIILSTPRGHRVMRPEFGSRLHELMFASINVETMATARHYVKDALGYWEPRIELVDVEAEPDPDEPSCLLILVTYRIKATHDERALVYPFYTIPGEG